MVGHSGSGLLWISLVLIMDLLNIVADLVDGTVQNC
jgi:hypothetical protein